MACSTALGCIVCKNYSIANSIPVQDPHYYPTHLHLGNSKQRYFVQAGCDYPTLTGSSYYCATPFSHAILLQGQFAYFPFHDKRLELILLSLGNSPSASPTHRTGTGLHNPANQYFFQFNRKTFSYCCEFTLSSPHHERSTAIEQHFHRK